MSENTPIQTPPAAPAATAPAASTDPVKTSTFSALLGLVKPEKKDVTPPPADKPVEKPVEKPAEKPVETAPEPKKTIKVSPRKPVDVADVVRQTVEGIKAAEPKPAPVAPVAETPKVDPDADLTPDEREELELIKYAEGKDPAKKGLADKYRAFYKASRAKLDELAKDDPDSNPMEDPRFKSWLAKNEPKLAPAERRKLFGETLAAKAKEDALREAEAKFTPRIQELERKHIEVVESPRIQQAVGNLETQVSTEAVPPELRQFLKDNQGDVQKLQAAFPIEYEAIDRAIENAKAVYKEYLRIERNVTSFDAKNGAHAFLAQFLDEQGRDVLATNPIREGKRFVHRRDYNPANAATTWTFSDADVEQRLQKLTVSAIKERISSERKRLEPYLAKQPAPTGASGAAPAAEPPANAAPRAVAGAPSGGAAPGTTQNKGGFSAMLGFGTRQ